MSVSVINLPKETRYRTLRIDIGENNEVYTIHTLDFLSNYSTYHWSQWIRHLLSNNDSRFWKYQYKLGNGQWTDMASNEYVFTTVGTYTIQYRVVDLAGNVSPSITRTVNRTSN